MSSMINIRNALGAAIGGLNIGVGIILGSYLNLCVGGITLALVLIVCFLDEVK